MCGFVCGAVAVWSRRLCLLCRVLSALSSWSFVVLDVLEVLSVLVIVVGPYSVVRRWSASWRSWRGRSYAALEGVRSFLVALLYAASSVRQWGRSVGQLPCVVVVLVVLVLPCFVSVPYSSFGRCCVCCRGLMVVFDLVAAFLVAVCR